MKLLSPPLAALMAVGAVVGGGCVTRGAARGACDPSPRSIPAAVRDSLTRVFEDRHARGGHRPMPDDEWARIARELPGGFAGLFFDTRREPGVRPVQGPLVVMLADTSHHEETLAALAPRVAAMRGGRGPDVRGAIVRRARWDFAQLYDWSHYLMNTAWTRGEITSSGIDEVRNRIVYGVVDEGAKSRLEMGLAARDVPCELVIVEVSGPVGKSMIRRQPSDAR